MKLIIQIPCFNEADSLERTVRDLPTALDPDHLDPAAPQLARARQDVRIVGLPAEGQDGVMLEQQELVRDLARDPSLDQRLLAIPGVAVRDPSEPRRLDPLSHDQSVRRA